MADDGRAVIAAELDKFITSEYGRELITNLLDLQKAKWAFCPQCKKKVQVDQPDYQAITRGLALLLDQGKGRPKEAVPPDPKIEEEKIRKLVREEVDGAIRAAFDNAT